MGGCTRVACPFTPASVDHLARSPCKRLRDDRNASVRCLVLSKLGLRWGEISTITSAEVSVSYVSLLQSVPISCSAPRTPTASNPTCTTEHQVVSCSTMPQPAQGPEKCRIYRRITAVGHTSVALRSKWTDEMKPVSWG